MKSLLTSNSDDGRFATSEFEVKLYIQSPPTRTKEFLSLLERDFVCIVAVSTAEGSKGVVSAAEGSSNESGFDQIFDRTLAAGWIVEKRAFSPLGDRIWDTAPMSAQNWLKISLPSGSVVWLSG